MARGPNSRNLLPNQPSLNQQPTKCRDPAYADESFRRIVHEKGRFYGQTTLYRKLIHEKRRFHGQMRFLLKKHEYE